VFAKRISWRKITIISLTEDTLARKKSWLWKIVTVYVIKSFACRPEIGLKHFDKRKPELARKPARPENPCPTYNSEFGSFRFSTTERYSSGRTESALPIRGSNPWSFTNPWIKVYQSVELYQSVDQSACYDFRHLWILLQSLWASGSSRCNHVNYTKTFSKTPNKLVTSLQCHVPVRFPNCKIDLSNGTILNMSWILDIDNLRSFGVRFYRI